MIKKLHDIKKLFLLSLLGLGILLLPTKARAGGFVVNGATVTLATDTSLSVAEEVTLNTGQLVANGSQIILGSTWTSTLTGTFTQGTSTVNFTGSAQKAFVGSTTFYRLLFTPATNATVEFTPATTQYITNKIDLQDLTLRSMTNNATWFLKVTGEQNLLNLDVKDSNALGGHVLIATNTIDSGNNRNWTFYVPDVGFRYWVGGSAGNWNSTANWSLLSGGNGGAQVPLSSHTVVFNGANGKNGDATVNTNVSIGTLTVSGYTGTLNFNGYNITISSALYHNTGTINLSTSPLTLQGNFIRTAGNFIAGGSTVTLSGGQDQTLTTAATNFANVIINKSGGTLAVSDELIVTGQWTNTSGTPVNNSTVTFAGTVVQQLTGPTTFFAVRALTLGTTLAFTASSTQTATNMIDFENLLLRSTTNGATWYFNYLGTGANQTLLNVDVQDSDASGGATLFPDSQSADLGDNENWAFTPNRRYWVGGVSGGWSNTANWSYASGGSGGAPVPTSTHTVVFDGRRGTNGDANITSNITITTLTISGYTGSLNTQGYTLSISSAYQQTSGSIVLSTSTLDIQGDFTYSGGTFNSSGSTTTFTSTKNQNITSGGASFNSVQVNKAGGTWTLADDLVLTGTFTYTAGTLGINGRNITVGGDWQQNAAAVTLTGSTVTFTGTPSTLYGPTTFYALRALTPNATLYMFKGSTQVVTNMLDLENILLRSTLNSATWYFRFAGTNQTLLDVDVRDSNANMGNGLFPDSQSTDSGNNRNWAFGGDKRYWVRTTAGNWNQAGSWGYSSGGVGIAPVPTSTHTVIFDGGIGGTAQGNITFNGDVTIATLTLSGYTTGTFSLNGYNLTISSAYVQSSGIVSLTSGTLNLNGTFNRTGGTFNANASTVSFGGTVDQTVNPNNTTLFNMVISKTAGTASPAGALNVLGSLTLNSGTFDTTPGNNYPITVSSHVVINNGTFNLNNSTLSVQRDWTYSAGTFNVSNSTVSFTGANNQSITSGGSSFNSVEVNKGGGTWTLADDMVLLGTFTYTAGTLGVNNRNITVNGDWRQNAASISLTGSTVTFTGASSTLFGPTTFYALRALTPNTTLYVVKGTTQVATNMLDLENIYLRSTLNNATWYFRFAGTNHFQHSGIRSLEFT